MKWKEMVVGIREGDGEGEWNGRGGKRIRKSKGMVVLGRKEKKEWVGNAKGGKRRLGKALSFENKSSDYISQIHSTNSPITNYIEYKKRQ